MTRRVEVTLTFGDRKISLEGPEDFIRGEVERLIQGSSPTALPPAPTAVQSQEPSVSERALLREKLPKGHSETIAVLAFALRSNGVPEFTEDDIRRAYLRGNVRPPKAIAQAIRDSKRNFDYVESGSSKGSYKLSAHGERTVIFDLPRESGGGI
jgi:hypothetical protein